MARIFISYSHVDRPFVDELVPLLERVYSHDAIWFDDELRGGDDWRQEIMRQIAACDIFVYLLSNESIESKYCQEEYAEALRLRKSVLPVQVRARAAVPPDLKRLQIVDMSDGVRQTLNFANLTAAIQKLSEKSARPLPGPGISQPVGSLQEAQQDRQKTGAGPVSARRLGSAVSVFKTMSLVRRSVLLAGVVMFAGGLIWQLWPASSHHPPSTTLALSGFRQQTITALGVDAPRSLNDLWVAVSGEGVYFSQLAENPLLPKEYVSAILPRSDADPCVGRRIFFGTNGGGLWVYDPAAKSSTHYGKAEGLSDDAITSLLCSGLDDLLVGTFSDLDRIALDQQQWTHFDLDRLKWQDQPPETRYAVRDLAFNPRTGDIWAITRDQLFQPGDPARRFSIKGAANPLLVQASDMTALCFTDDGQLALGSGPGQVLLLSAGLDTVAEDDDIWRDISPTTGQLNMRITDLACGPAGYVVAATANTGVWVYDLAGKRWTTYEPQLGFYAILPQVKGALLAGSNGVYQLTIHP